jgi:hypothetical protein
MFGRRRLLLASAILTFIEEKRKHGEARPGEISEVTAGSELGNIPLEVRLWPKRKLLVASFHGN